MCIGTPMQVISLAGGFGLCRREDQTDDRAEAVDLSLVPHVQPGEFVLVFLGAARAIIDAEYARQVADAHAALLAVANGENPDFGFEDLLKREPSLPPHLEAARDAGKSFG